MTFKWGLTDPGHRFNQGTKIEELHDTWKVEAVRNGNIFAQVILECDEAAVATLGPSLAFDWTGALPRLRVEATWTDAHGTVLAQPPADVKLQWIGYVPGDKGNMAGDPLLSAESLTLEAGDPQAIWINVHTSKDAQPGSYQLALNLYVHKGWEAEDLAASCSVTVDVHDITLPDPADYGFYLDLWQHHTRWAQFYNVPRWSERHWSIIESFAKELASAGQKAITVVVSDAPWAGQGCWDVPHDPYAFYEFNTVSVVRGHDGTLHCDFAVMDRLIETYLAAGIDQEIEVIGLLGAWHDVFGTPLTDYPDPIRVRLYDEANNRYDYIRTQAELREYVRQLVQHLKERGWFEKTRISSDEPKDLQRFHTCVAFLRGIEPDLRFKIACNHHEFMDEFKDEILDWVPNLASLTLDASLTKRLTNQVRERGGRMSWYICLHPEYPNNFFHSPVYETRLLGWMTDWFGVDGFLRWAFAAWAPDPWNKPAWKFPGGDLLFVYPGQDGTPMSSVRWETLKQAIQEFELLRMLRAKIDEVGAADPKAKADLEARLNAAVARVILVDGMGEFRVSKKRPEELYATDPGAYDVARAEVIRMLTELSN